MKKLGIILLIVFLSVGLLNLPFRNKIDPGAYPVYIDYGLLNQEQIRVMDAILLCGKSDSTVVEHDLSSVEFEQVIDGIGLYFGANLTHQNVALWRPGYGEVNPELLRRLEQDKTILDQKIDQILSGMYEGSDRFKLWQISRFLAKTIKYSYKLNDIEPLSGLAGRGSCMTYAMLFYKMAARLGIPVQICYGYADNGKQVAMHAWNAVILDGTQYFYDVTWYDNFVPDWQYIHSKTPWNRENITQWRIKNEENLH